ncbi:MAG: hypothetical protein HGJ94_09040 [Desulfosarcina sp.]|nr:hypothetical protein [Desulfosarcina sp.]MBC2742858.1 hypothetical protein [Desulfosarcina sp.]MBC2765768.1 hypothetical protein [Desulfosarcina sp.]
MIEKQPCFVVGPNMDTPLSHHLKKHLVVLPKETSPLQFVHDQVVEEPTTQPTKVALECELE